MAPLYTIKFDVFRPFLIILQGGVNQYLRLILHLKMILAWCQSKLNTTKMFHPAACHNLRTFVKERNCLYGLVINIDENIIGLHLGSRDRLTQQKSLLKNPLDLFQNWRIEQ